VYYNVFISKFVPAAKTQIGGYMIYKLGITSKSEITKVIELTGASLLAPIVSPTLLTRESQSEHHADLYPPLRHRQNFQASKEYRVPTKVSS
jgi:hypothetical protein